MIDHRRVSMVVNGWPVERRGDARRHGDAAREGIFASA